VSGPVQTVYVSNGRGGTVTPIDTATNTPGPPILIGRGPGLIAITPDGKTAYVTSDESIVVPIDTATNTPGPPIAVGVNRPGLHDQPDGIAITPDGKTVYVANIGSGRVTPIDTATNTPGEPVEVGVRPRAIVITPDGKTAYVVNQSRPQPPPWHSYEAEKRGLPPQPAPDPRGTATPIDTATNTPGKPIDVGSEPFAITVTPDGKTVYVANTWENTGRPASAPGTVTPIATATNTPGAPIEVGSQPWAFAITPDGKTAYVINFASASVTPIATATNTPGPPIPVGQGPRAIAITPDGRTAYVASWQSGTVTPIATVTNTAGTPIEVGEGARAIVITPDGKTAYVAVWGEPGTVTPIATATNTAGTPIEVGDGPYAIAVTP
jgi:YVTN family beta-propeller protein